MNCEREKANSLLFWPVWSHDTVPDWLDVLPSVCVPSAKDPIRPRVWKVTWMSLFSIWPLSQNRKWPRIWNHTWRWSWSTSRVHLPKKQLKGNTLGQPLSWARCIKWHAIYPSREYVLSRVQWFEVNPGEDDTWEEQNWRNEFPWHRPVPICPTVVTLVTNHHLYIFSEVFGA